METLYEPARRVPRPPGWVSLLVAVATALWFLLFFEFGVDPVVDAVIEGLYLS